MMLHERDGMTRWLVAYVGASLIVREPSATSHPSPCPFITLPTGPPSGFENSPDSGVHLILKVGKVTDGQEAV